MQLTPTVAHSSTLFTRYLKKKKIKTEYHTVVHNSDVAHRSFTRAYTPHKDHKKLKINLHNFEVHA